MTSKFTPNPARGAANGNWGGNTITYGGAHYRVRRARGHAKDQLCLCGSPATAWAYNGLDPDERIGTKNGYSVKFSCDPKYYIAMCGSCHSVMDAPESCPSGHKGNFKTGRRGDGSTFRICRDCARIRQRERRQRAATMVARDPMARYAADNTTKDTD